MVVNDSLYNYGLYNYGNDDQYRGQTSLVEYGRIIYVVIIPDILVPDSLRNFDKRLYTSNGPRHEFGNCLGPCTSIGITVKVSASEAL